MKYKKEFNAYKEKFIKIYDGLREKYEYTITETDNKTEWVSRKGEDFHGFMSYVCFECHRGHDAATLALTLSTSYTESASLCFEMERGESKLNFRVAMVGGESGLENLAELAQELAKNDIEIPERLKDYAAGKCAGNCGTDNCTKAR